ncbi:hypothetical protein MPRS_47640 [Mycobacterium paraseoulense]|nr:hypothetical protein MPRS_47640 [Mycobacterium paraseoulense]
MSQNRAGTPPGLVAMAPFATPDAAPGRDRCAHLRATTDDVSAPKRGIGAANRRFSGGAGALSL